MKRLVVPVLMCATMLLPSTIVAQSRDLAGSWVLDAEKSGTKDATPNGYKTKAAWKGSKLEATLINSHGETDVVNFSHDGAW